jgi:hypothetical protein
VNFGKRCLRVASKDSIRIDRIVRAEYELSSFGDDCRRIQPRRHGRSAWPAEAQHLISYPRRSLTLSEATAFRRYLSITDLSLSASQPHLSKLLLSSEPSVLEETSAVMQLSLWVHSDITRCGSRHSCRRATETFPARPTCVAVRLLGLEPAACWFTGVSTCNLYFHHYFPSVHTFHRGEMCGN